MDVRLLEQIEAFRPGVDNLDDPMWAELRTAIAEDPDLLTRIEHSQSHDQVLRTAMHEVAVPVGLEDRLLVKLLGQEEVATATVDLPARNTTSQTNRRSWGLLLGGILTVAGAAALVFMFVGQGGSNDPVSIDTLTASVQEWEQTEDLLNADRWLEAASPTLKSFPLDAAVLVPARRGQVWTSSAGKLAVYELVRKDGKVARLYVVPTSRPYNVAGSPMTSLSLTGRRSVGAWQRKGTLYVLVVDPRDANVWDFVRPPRVA